MQRHRVGNDVAFENVRCCLRLSRCSEEADVSCLGCFLRCCPRGMTDNRAMLAAMAGSQSDQERAALQALIKGGGQER